MNLSTTRLLFGLCLTLGLAGCGGGQDPSATADKSSDTTATSSTSGPSSQTTNVTESEKAAWSRNAELNHAEVAQPESSGTLSANEEPTLALQQFGSKAFVAPSAPIYRFFSNQTGAHLLTKSVSERDTILNTLPQYRYEGPVFSAWQSTDTGLYPVYRFANTQTGAHVYTISEAEKNNIQGTMPWMRLEGTAYYASKTALTGTAPLYRFYHLQRGFHFYTASATERDSLIAHLAATYRYEGVGYYVNASISTYNRALASFAGKANTPGYNNALGEDARFRELRGMAFDPAGNLYVTDGADSYMNRTELRKISAAGLVTSFVGSQQGYGRQDGVGSGARFAELRAVTFDAAGTAFVGDDYTVRKITSAGLVTTIAGSLSGNGYVNGQAQSARFNKVNGIAVDSIGNIYVSDNYNHVIRKIATTGVVSTFAGADPTVYSRAGYADGVGTAARFYYPGQLAIDANDNLYVADEYNHRIRKITPAGLVTTLAGQSPFGVVDGLGSSARFEKPHAIAVNKASGDVYTADWAGYTVRRITPSGDVTTVVGAAYSRGVFFGSLPAGLDRVGGLAVRGNRLYIASLNGIYWTNLPQ